MNAVDDGQVPGSAPDSESVENIKLEQCGVITKPETNCDCEKLPNGLKNGLEETEEPVLEDDGGKKVSDDDTDPDALTIDEGEKIKSLKVTIRKPPKKPANKKTKIKNARGVKRRMQPTSLRCPRCPNSAFVTVSSLLEHQRSCGALSAPTTQVPETARTPRKVYMCSSCGSYFENWNLFLHMKEMHKRNICLYCLGMFSQAAKLTQHLATKHRVMEEILEYGDQLSKLYPGSHFLLCTRCDRMCTDQDFESHSCSTVCSHCGLAGTHYPTCRLAPQVPPRIGKNVRRKSRAPKRPRKQPLAPPLEPPPPESDPAAETPQDPHNPADDLSPNTYNEKMYQLLRGKERSFSTIESIEDSINRVLVKVEEEEPIIPEPVEELVNEILPPEPVVEKSEPESSDSEKLTIELNPRRRQSRVEPEPVVEEDVLQLAGDDTPFTCVPLPEPLDTGCAPTAMKLFLRATALTCVYCAHARKIAVNAKQLALHQLAEHRYITVAESMPQQEKLDCYTNVVKVMREIAPTLEDVYFNAYGFDSSDKSAWRPADRVYECFHCSYITPDPREFSSHNRKIHLADIRKSRQTENHLCIMCKTRFLTYSELLCHLCRGVYVSGEIIDPHCRYRCYACDIEPLPSSFRLMVHLRLTHTGCDMCFTLCDSQTALSAHVLKHKSLYYCYACALTYETRQELSKHIFWKHGAESVTCKRCLQKKWRHAYHFCLPPAGFACEACGSWFKTAAARRVHSRIHAGEFPHACTLCDEKFITRKLLAKHAVVHEDRKSLPEPVPVNGHVSSEHDPTTTKKEKKPKKDLRDLFDLPPVNLSESDDSSGDEQTADIKDEEKTMETDQEPAIPLPPPLPQESEPAPVTVWDGVLASLEETEKGRSYPPDSPFFNLPMHRVIAIVLGDHDYCREGSTKPSIDHDYCDNGETKVINKSPVKHSPRKPSKRRNRSSSSDSSSSSSSSCSCGSNCSCSSSSSSTESATSGDGRTSKKKTSKLNKSNEKHDKKPEVETEQHVDVCDVQESDLETDEPITDDDEFYEQNPALRAKDVLLLNRSMLLDKLTASTPSSPIPHVSRRKMKSKKRRSDGSKRMSKMHREQPVSSRHVYAPHTPVSDDYSGESEGKRPRRRRVPLRFYGFSSGDEEETPTRKRERLVEHNTTTAAPVPQEEPSTATVTPTAEPSNLWNSPAWRPPPVPPRVHPIKIKTGSLKQTFAKSNNSDEFHIKRAELGGFHVNGSGAVDAVTKSEKLYCFCQCPYDEVSEMIACDAQDCAIEWFHFECVGIMDPPKGKWFCPNCKKKAAAESEMMSIPLR